MQSEVEIRKLSDLALEMAKIRELVELGAVVSLSWTTEREKSDKQRSALHIWCEQLAQVLNEGGFDMRVYLRDYAKPGVNAKWSKYSVKEIFYKPTLEAMTGKRSTEEMNTMEPSEICAIVGKALSERLGITPPPWPTRFGDS